MKIFVSGGLGFMGSDFIRYLFEIDSTIEVLNFDKMTYAGNPANVASVAKNRHYHFVKGDIADAEKVNNTVKNFRPDIILNFAAETHVDRSILNPSAFIQTDVVGTQTLLEAVRKHKIRRFVQISTDEVYGSIERGTFSEDSPLKPNSPYAASKAGGDLMVRAYVKTYKVPAITTHACNNFGPHQYPEKVIPLFITNLLEGKKVPLYGKGTNVREWIYVRDHSRAVWLLATKGKVGEAYNIGTGAERSNLVLTNLLIRLTGKTNAEIQRVADRPGHDLRYALNTKKIAKLGFKPSVNFEEGLNRTVAWYRENEQWWKKIKSGEYQAYYKKNYARR
ncbi:dTDP-glucose 4,6-dehydratase [Candidatus Berkelbacteria bacterium]|nr:dTDP-glucose 4,6-dehydratase [Candidatus Berkelbacteria bacterium]